MSIDTRLYAGLAQMQRALDGLLQVREQVTEAEIALSDQWQAELQPVLRDLYWWPFRNGFATAPDTAGKLRSWLENQYENDNAVRPLRESLQRYQVRAANLGGQMALDDLSISGTFRLTNADYLAALDDHAAMLASQNTELSLIDTTIDDLVGGIIKADRTLRSLADGVFDVVGSLIADWTTFRAGLIAVTETARLVAGSINQTLYQNDVLYQLFVTREDRNVCKLCGRLHGERMPVRNIPPHLRIPVHGRCRCRYRAELLGWTLPDAAWRGGEARQPVQPQSAPRPRYLPSRNNINVALGNSEQYMRDAMQRLGITRQELEQGAEQALRGLTSNGRMAIQYPSQRIDALLSDDKFKTLFDTGNSNAHAQSLDFRRDIERFGMGIPKNAAASARPVHGYLHVGVEAEAQVSHYGDLTVFLRDEVRNRSTFTVADSSFPLQQREMVASSFGNVQRATWQPNAGALYEYGKGGNLSKLLREIDYIETQVQGGVSLGDVSAILDRNGVLTAAQRAAFEQKGITIWRDVP